jgi:hypothetical protein
MLLLSLFQELSILQDLDDARGECRAHGNLGAVHLSLSNYINAMKCYQEQLDKAVRKNKRDYLDEFVLLDNYFAFLDGTLSSQIAWKMGLTTHRVMTLM